MKTGLVTLYTGTRITISDKYAISGNGKLVENIRLPLPEIAYLSEIVIPVPVLYQRI